jgi:hypothetical protein
MRRYCIMVVSASEFPLTLLSSFLSNRQNLPLGYARKVNV